MWLSVPNVLAKMILPLVSADSLLGLLFNHEDGGDMFFQNSELSPNSRALQPKRLYSS
jgi:hypothetical protein